VVGLCKTLGEDVDIPIEERTRIVASGFDVGGVGATPQGRGHLLGRFHQRIPYDFKLYRIVHILPIILLCFIFAASPIVYALLPEPQTDVKYSPSAKRPGLS
jgi:hypothetical protein